MIVPFYGELLLQCVPLELSLNYCSHQCAYCFANLNKADRRAAPQSIVNLLAECNERDTLEAYLLRERYPVLMSNKSDPFASSNWKLTLQILELLAELKVPVAFQTKGGKGIEEALDLIQPSCWYWTITTFDEDKARQIEPGSPSPSERLRQMAMIKERGHHVWVGVNPVVRQWMGDAREFAKRLAGNGVQHVWTEVLHLSRDQMQAMTPKSLAAITSEVASEALARTIPQAMVDGAMNFIEAAREQGIKVGCKHWPEESHVIDDYARFYPKRFPTMTEWTDHCWQTKRAGDEFTFREWADFMLALLPTVNKKSLRHYIHSCSRNLGKRIRFKDSVTFEDVLRIIWMERDHRMNPSRSRAFKKVVLGEMDGAKIYKLDESGLPIRYFTGRKMERQVI